MDFFEHQELARRNTRLLLAYYTLAVVLIVAAVYLATYLIFRAHGDPLAFLDRPGQLWNPEWFLWSAALTLGLIGAGTGYKILQLSGDGGATLAELLGGRPVPPDSRGPAERRLLNVVEEMAIAAGLPVPRVYLLGDEPGINAFAAGFTPGQAVIGVTRGCLEQLTRDELQGVVAHEFSHIQNGDMRLNLRLLGVLNGILLIALVGYGLLRALSFGGSSSSRRSSNDKKGGGLAVILLLGLALLVIGGIGVFFARLIQAAVSRQREFLADAAAVQFTRNPAGLAGALRKIARRSGGGRLDTPQAQAASHLFFANALSASWFNLFATHPPLDERLHRLDPTGILTGTAAPAAGADAESASAVPATSPVMGFAATPGGHRTVTPAAAVGRIGEAAAADMGAAAGLLAALPPAWRDAARTPHGAAAVAAGLLLAPAGSAARAAQEPLLTAQADPRWRNALAALTPAGGELPRAARLPLLDLAAGTLAALPPADRQTLCRLLGALARADGELDLFEYLLLRLAERRLEPAGAQAPPRLRQYYSLNGVRPEAAVLLGALARTGAATEADAARAFAAAEQQLGSGVHGIALPPAAACGLPQVDAALNRLGQATPAIQRRLLEAAAAAIASDGVIQPEEAELFRAVAESFDCPVPPLAA
ncbi:MAG: M48 family metallopeptidase [Lentisphaeria bacterium]